MGYLEWIRALDRAHQYASLNGDKLTHLCLDGATFDLNGFFSHAEGWYVCDCECWVPDDDEIAMDDDVDD